MAITIKDVAKKANVSIATVSRIVNNQSGYSSGTKEKVLKAIKELGYSPNALARGLVGQPTRTIGVLLPNVSSLFAGKLLEGIEDEAKENGYSVVVCNTGTQGLRAMGYLDMLNEKRVEGIIYGSGDMTKDQGDKLSALNIPVVMVATKPAYGHFPYVKVNDKKAAFDATRCLLDHGHTRIAFIGGQLEDPIAGRPRYEGFIQAMNERDLPIDESLIKFGDFSFNSGKEMMTEFVEEGASFTALFATSDEMAVGVLHAAYEKGIRVPDDLSVIGYDNTLASEMAIPPLTTVAQPLYEMGQKAFQRVIKTGATQIEMKHHMVERETVKSRRT
ncbi:LacI family DNA-binding transcriptional regulator [Alteribacter aurantiacus]|uniref:LacI family DNA-binding transcriptional regulator n=1 Tax=Alteribacter aurantiacus TaxID=254410 RepID=UPI0003FCED93|nr:LacI family DNA-binding transcriptional regulator [Alteribacter aurantiacus]